MVFANPLVLGGLVLAAVPIVIHLLNRRRFVVVHWAPMQYLQLTLKTNRRRMRLEQLLLMLLRTLIVVVLILAVARPVTRGGLILGGGRAFEVIVLDDTLSMGYVSQGRTAYARAMEAVGQLAAQRRSQDDLVVLTTSNPNRPLGTVGGVDDLTQQLAGITLTDAHALWSSTFEAVDRQLQSTQLPVQRVTLVTDLRASGWSPEVADWAGPWAEQGVRCRIVDVGAPETANVTLQRLMQIDAAAVPGASVRFEAYIRNDLEAPLSSSAATFSVAGQQQTVVLPELAPGRVGHLSLRHTFTDAGQFMVQLQLAEDSLVGDNVQRMMVQVRPQLDIVLVDGEPSCEPFESETDFLALAFSVGHLPWRVRQKGDHQWLAEPPLEPDLLVLANVSAVPPDRAQWIEQQVRDGMGLMIFLGPQVDADQYNQILFRDGDGLLPGQLAMTLDEPVTGLIVEPLTESPLAVLARLTPASLAGVSARQYKQLVWDSQPPPPVRVLARWNDQQSSPAIVEKRLGRGRVVLWTTTADRQWTDWPLDATFVLSTREVASQIARSSYSSANLVAGQPIRFTVPDGQRPLEAKVLIAGAEQDQPVHHQQVDDHHVLSYTSTYWAGAYEVSWADESARQARKRKQIVVNQDRRESELDPVDRDLLTRWLEDLDPVIVPFGPELAASEAAHEVWRRLVWLLLALVVVETMLATWVGRRK